MRVKMQFLNKDLTLSVKVLVFSDNADLHRILKLSL